MYTQEFRVSDESLPALLKIADFLLIEPLVEDMIAYLKKILATQNCVTIQRACQAENVPSGLLDDIVTKCVHPVEYKYGVPYLKWNKWKWTK